MFGTYARNVIAGQGRYIPDVDDKVLNNPALNRAHNTKAREIPVVDLYRCIYRKEEKYLSLVSEYMGMPAEFAVRSHHTGKVVTFKAVQPGDPLWDEDGWDGEQCIYRPTTTVPNVEYMVIYNQW